MNLAERLAELAGAAVTDNLASEHNLGSWEAAERAGVHARFEFRVLVGLAVWDGRPSQHGQIGAYEHEVAERLGRTDRWVRSTTRVAREIRKAVQQGVDLPLELREVSWIRVPRAIENVRSGRPLDWVEPKPPTEDPARWESDVRRQLAALAAGLDAVPLGGRWRAMLCEARTTLRELEERGDPRQISTPRTEPETREPPPGPSREPHGPRER